MTSTMLTTGTVKWDGKPQQTKYGMKAKAVVILLSGEEIQLWGNENDKDILTLKQGESVQLVSIKGKWKLANTTSQASQPTTTANSSNGTAKPQPQPMSPEQKLAVAAYVEEQANLLAFCIDQAHKSLVSKFPNQSFPVESEAVRTAGLTLYISAQKRFSL